MSQHHRNDKLPVRAWARLRIFIFNRDGWKCVNCGSNYRLECDHIRALADGGDNHPANLRTICRSCHMKVSADTHRQHPVKGQAEWAEAFKRHGVNRGSV